MNKTERMIALPAEEKTGLPHVLHMENNSKLFVSGVAEAGNFDEQNVILYLTDGKLTIRGNGLKLERLSVETGEAALCGQVTALLYSDAGPRAKGLLAKVLR